MFDFTAIVKSTAVLRLYTNINRIALTQSPTYCIMTFDLDLQSQESYGHDPYICKRSLSSKVRVETDGWKQLHYLTH